MDLSGHSSVRSNDLFKLLSILNDKDRYGNFPFSQRRTSEEKSYPTQVTIVVASLDSFETRDKHTGKGATFIQQAPLRRRMVTSGNQDLVRCFHCGIGLNDRIKEDHVLPEHGKHSSTCGKNPINRMKAALATESNNESASSPPTLQYPIRSPRYQTMEARVASFELFPSRINVPHQQLAASELFHTGQGDLCRCFTCGMNKNFKSGYGLVKEHSTYFPNRPYINNLKGKEYVHVLQESRAGSELMGQGATGRNSALTESSRNLQLDIEYNADNWKERHYNDEKYEGPDKASLKTRKRCLLQSPYKNKFIQLEWGQGDLKVHGTRHSRTSTGPNQSIQNRFEKTEISQDSGYTFDFKKVVRKCFKSLVWHMCPQMVLDESCHFLTEIEIRDIEELQLTSDKNRQILRKVMTKGIEGYEAFKKALNQSKQAKLVGMLEEEERPC